MTIHMTFAELRAAQPDLPLDIIQRLGHEAGGIKPLVCDGIAGPRTKSGIYLDPQAVRVAHSTPASIALDELLAGAQEIDGRNAGPWVMKYARLSPTGGVGRDQGWLRLKSSNASSRLVALWDRLVTP